MNTSSSPVIVHNQHVWVSSVLTLTAPTATETTASTDPANPVHLSTCQGSSDVPLDQASLSSETSLSRSLEHGSAVTDVNVMTPTTLVTMTNTSDLEAPCIPVKETPMFSLHGRSMRSPFADGPKARLFLDNNKLRVNTHTSTDAEDGPQSSRSPSTRSVDSSLVATPTDVCATDLDMQPNDWRKSAHRNLQPSRHEEYQQRSTMHALDNLDRDPRTPSPSPSKLGVMPAHPPHGIAKTSCLQTTQDPPPYASVMVQSSTTHLSRSTSLPHHASHTLAQRPQSAPLYLLQDSPSCLTAQLRQDAKSLLSPPPAYAEPSWRARAQSCILPQEEEEEEGCEELPSYTCTVYKMGTVLIKREMDTPEIRTRWRFWRKVYLELRGTLLRVYAPSNTPNEWFWRKSHSREAFETISLAGADAGRALDYTRRPNVLRLTTARGPQMLLRLPDSVEMISWIEHLQAAINISLDLECRPMPRFFTLPFRNNGSSPLSQSALAVEYAREQRRRRRHYQQSEMLI